MSRRLWKEFCFGDINAWRAMKSAWPKAPGSDEHVRFENDDLMITDLSLNDVRMIARSVDVDLPDYVTGSAEEMG